MNRESACGLVILACLGMAACGPEGLEAQQGHEEEELLRAARSEARGMQRWSKSETSLEVCHWNEQGLDAVAFVTDEEDFSTQPVRVYKRGYHVLKNGSTVTIVVGDEDDHSPDALDVVADEDDHSGFLIFVSDEEDSITAARDWQYVPW